MKKKNRGTAGFVIGIIVYTLLSLLSLFIAFNAFMEASYAYQVQEQMLLMAGGFATALFIALTLWFISFTVKYNQGKSQIELLEELRDKQSI